MKFTWRFFILAEVANFIIKSTNLPYFENKIRKFHQSGITFIGNEGNYKREKIANEKEFLPDNYVNKLEVQKLDTRYREVFKTIHEVSCKRAYRFFLTVLFTGVEGIKDGVYYYDGKDYIYQIKEIDEELIIHLRKIDDCKVIISFFVDVRYSVFLNKINGYKDALIEIGYLLSKITESTELVFNENDKNLDFNSFTHALGVNLNEQLLSKNLFLGD